MRRGILACKLLFCVICLSPSNSIAVRMLTTIILNPFHKTRLYVVN